MGDRPQDKPLAPRPLAEVKVPVDAEHLRKARFRAFELGTTVEKLLARLVDHLAKEHDQLAVLQQQQAPPPSHRSTPVGETGERIEIRRPVLPPRPGRTGKTG